MLHVSRAVNRFARLNVPVGMRQVCAEARSQSDPRCESSSGAQFQGYSLFDARLLLKRIMLAIWSNE